MNGRYTSNGAPPAGGDYSSTGSAPPAGGGYGSSAPPAGGSRFFQPPAGGGYGSTGGYPPAYTSGSGASQVVRHAYVPTVPTIFNLPTTQRYYELEDRNDCCCVIL